MSTEELASDHLKRCLEAFHKCRQGGVSTEDCLKAFKECLATATDVQLRVATPSFSKQPMYERQPHRDYFGQFADWLRAGRPLEDCLAEFLLCVRGDRFTGPPSPYRPGGEVLGPDTEILARLSELLEFVLQEPVPVRKGFLRDTLEEATAIEHSLIRRLMVLESVNELKYSISLDDLTSEFQVTTTPLEHRRTLGLELLSEIQDDSLERELVNILLEAVGVKEVAEALLEWLEAKGLFKAMRDALKAKDWVKLLKLLGEVLESLTSKQFRDFLVRKVGREGAEKFLKKLLKKLIPIIGWLLFALDLLAAIKDAWPELSKKLGL